MNRRHVLRQAAFSSAGSNRVGHVLEGRPADVLTAAATAADLLVLGSHGHTRRCSAR
ncbi:hypothetical protein [Micromonospora sp. NPDC049679]|uniref:hypothetical protein n=1 Tax=Micromonospora sp. NPDC049679 TaxID=3155920 RepID=UPI0033D16B9E